MLARAALAAALLLATACTTSGPRPETVLATGQAGPSALATDGTHLYWTNTAGGELMRLPLAGGTPERLVSGQSQPRKLALGPTHVYWANRGSSSIMKAPLAGGEATVVAADQADLEDVAVAGDILFWADGSSLLMKAPLAGGAASAVSQKPSGSRDIATSATHVLLGQQRWHHPPRAPGGWSRGAPRRWRISTPPASRSMTRTCTGAPSPAACTGSPWRAAPGRSWWTAETRPHSLAVDGAFLYWAAGSKDGTIRRMTRSGGKPETFAGEQAEPTGLVVHWRPALLGEPSPAAAVVRAPQ